MADTDSVASSLFPVPKSHLFNGRYDANSWEYKLNDVFQRVKDMGDSIRKDDSLMQLLSQFLDAQAEELGPIPTIDSADVAPVFLKVAYVPRSYSAYVRTIIFGRHCMVHLGENFNWVDKWHWIDDKCLNKRCLKVSRASGKLLRSDDDTQSEIEVCDIRILDSLKSNSESAWIST